jgi:hypothetical protein
LDLTIRLEEPLYIGSKRSTLGNHMGQCEVLLGTPGNNKNPKNPICALPTLPKGKKTWSIGAIPHWVEVLFLWLYIYIIFYFLFLKKKFIAYIG